MSSIYTKLVDKEYMKKLLAKLILLFITWFVLTFLIAVLVGSPSSNVWELLMFAGSIAFVIEALVVSGYWAIKTLEIEL